MADLRLITKRQAGVPPRPFQQGEPDVYFGEQSNDIQLSTVNDFETISGTEKLKQDVNKILLTELGENISFESYGTELQNMIGGKANDAYLRAKIQEQIISALEALNFINRSNSNEDEIPQTLDTLSIDFIASDTIEIGLAILTKSGKLVSTSVVITT